MFYQIWLWYFVKKSCEMKFKVSYLHHPAFFVDIILQFLLPSLRLFNQLDLGITPLPPYFLNIFLALFFFSFFYHVFSTFNFFFFNLFPEVANNELGKIKKFLCAALFKTKWLHAMNSLKCFQLHKWLSGSQAFNERH